MSFREEIEAAKKMVSSQDELREVEAKKMLRLADEMADFIRECILRAAKQIEHGATCEYCARVMLGDSSGKIYRKNEKKLESFFTTRRYTNYELGDFGTTFMDALRSNLQKDEISVSNLFFTRSLDRGGDYCYHYHQSFAVPKNETAREYYFFLDVYDDSTTPNQYTAVRDQFFLPVSIQVLGKGNDQRIKITRDEEKIFKGERNYFETVAFEIKCML